MSNTINIKVNVDNSIENDSTNKLRVKRSQRVGNTLEVFDGSGLYAPALPGDDAPPGTGFPDGYRSDNGIESGVTSPEDSTAYPRRIIGLSYIHRIFTCTATDGSNINLRECDLMYPGDMFRVHDTTNHNWNYYIILSVNSTGKSVTKCTGAIACIPDNSNIN